MTLFKITRIIIAVKLITFKFSRLFKSIILFSTFSQTSILKHQSIKQIIKFYFIVIDFYIIFHEKNRKKNLNVI